MVQSITSTDNKSNILLTEKDVAQRLRITEYALRRWRFERRGPKFVKLENRSVRYDLDELDAWLRTQPTGGGAA